MYYSNNNYKNIPVPLKFQKDIALRAYNGKTFVLDKEKQLMAKKQDIINAIELKTNEIAKNDTRYKYADNHAEYDDRLKKELILLESQLKNL